MRIEIRAIQPVSNRGAFSPIYEPHLEAILKIRQEMRQYSILFMVTGCCGHFHPCFFQTLLHMYILQVSLKPIALRANKWRSRWLLLLNWAPQKGKMLSRNIKPHSLLRDQQHSLPHRKEDNKIM